MPSRCAITGHNMTPNQDAARRAPSTLETKCCRQTQAEEGKTNHTEAERRESNRGPFGLD